MKKGNTAFALLTLGLIAGFSSATSAQTGMERIEVRGERTKHYFEKQLEKAQFEFIDTYNALNDIPNFNIYCETRRPIGTKIHKKECLPQFFRETMAREASAYLMGASKVYQPERAVILSSTERKAFHAHLEKLATESDELLAKLVAVAELKQKIEDMNQAPGDGD